MPVDYGAVLKDIYEQEVALLDRAGKHFGLAGRLSTKPHAYSRGQEGNGCP